MVSEARYFPLFRSAQKYGRPAAEILCRELAAPIFVMAMAVPCNKRSLRVGCLLAMD